MLSKKNAAVVFAAIFALVLFIICVSFAWHSFAIKNPVFSLSLKGYDKLVSDGNACFVLGFDYQNIDPAERDLFIEANGKVVDSYKLEMPVDAQKNICVPNALLNDGNNTIEAGVLARTVFFHVEKNPSLDLNTFSSSSIKLFGVSKDNDYKVDINFSIVNSPSRQEPLEIFVNGEMVSDGFFSDGSHAQTVRVSPGANSIKLVFAGTEQSASFVNDTAPQSDWILGALFIAFSLFVFMAFVFGKKPLLENIAFSLCFFFAALIALFFVLNYLGILSGVSFVLCFFVLMLAIAVFFRKNFHLPEIVLQKPNYFVLFLVFFLLAILFFNMVTQTDVSFWTSFYERQSRDIFENNGVPFFDQFTHFGDKPYGYMSGYFFVNAGISYLLGAQSETVFAIILFLANAALIICATLFFRKIGMSDKQSLLTTMLMLLGGFLIGDIFFNARHIVSLALGFLSLYLLASKKPVLGGILLGFSVFVQTPIVLIFAILAFALVKIDRNNFVKYFVSGAVVSLVLFAPTFILHGLPTQAKMTTWGYLFGMPWYGVLVDLLAQIIFFFLIMLPAVSFRLKFDRTAKKAAIIVVLLLIVQLFISYRVNVANTVLVSFLAVYLFPKRLLEQVEVRHLLIVIFIFGTLIASSVLLNFVVPDYSIHAADELALFSPSDSRLLVEPALGHYVAYFSERKIMADLAVEYADEGLIDDSFSFILDKNQSLLSKHNIDFVFSRISFVEIAPVGSSGTDKPVEFPFLDKIYDDSVYSIHKVN